MSDTEYDNASDDDADDDWMVEAAVPPSPDRLRSHDRAFQSNERYSSGPAGPPNRQVTQPVQTSFKFHKNSSIDSESVCSGTFTIDLSTLQGIQNLRQPNLTASQPDQFTGQRNKRRTRPHTSLAVSDPEPVPYDRGDEYRVPYSYPHSRQVADERQPQFAAGRQFHERLKDDPRNYPPAPASHRNFAGNTAARYESFQSYRDYNDYDRNPYRYEPPSYKEVRGSYRRQELDRDNWTDYDYTDVHHAREEEHRRLPDSPDRGRVVERAHLARSVDDPAVYRSSASGNGCTRSHFNGRYEDYRLETKDRYDHVPTRDIPPPQMTGISPLQTEYKERQQWHSGRVSHSRNQTPSYHELQTGNEDQPASRYESLSAGDDGKDRYPSSVTAKNFEPEPRYQEPRDRWKPTRFQVESGARPRSSSATRNETESHSQASAQSRRYTARDEGGRVAQFQAPSFESQSYTRFQDETRVRPRSSSASRSETELPLQAAVHSREYTVRESGGNVAQFPTPRFESQSYSRTATEQRGDARHGNRSFSIPTKGRDSSASSRSSSRDRRSAYPDEPDFPQDVSDENRSSDVQDGRRRTGERDKQDTHCRLVIREPKAQRTASETRREDRSRRVKFQSDPNLTHTYDSTTAPQSSNDSGRSSEGKRTHTATGRVASDGSRQSSDRRYQSAESLRSSLSQSRDQDREYSSQTSLPAQSRSASAERNRQTVPRTGSLEQVSRGDRTRMYLKDRARSRDSSGDRRRVLPRAPLAHRQSTDDQGSSSVIRDVATEIARMTSSVKSLDSEPPDRPLLDGKSSTHRSRKLGVEGTSQTVTEGVSRLTMSASDLDSYSSTSSALRTRERLDDQKRKKTQMRQGGLSGNDATLLAQIQDDLQSEISRYTAELEAGTRPTSWSVVSDKDPKTPPAENGNIIYTALIDSQVCVMPITYAHETCTHKTCVSYLRQNLMQVHASFGTNLCWSGSSTEVLRETCGRKHVKRVKCKFLGLVLWELSCSSSLPSSSSSSSSIIIIAIQFKNMQRYNFIEEYEISSKNLFWWHKVKTLYYNCLSICQEHKRNIHRHC